MVRSLRENGSAKLFDAVHGALRFCRATGR